MNPLRALPALSESRARVAAAAVTLPVVAVSAVAWASPASAATVVNVSTAAQLTSALANAAPGTSIVLADGTYTGQFVGAKSAPFSNPIKITGTRRAVLTTGSTSTGTALSIGGAQWRLTGFTVTKALNGIEVSHSWGTVIDKVEVGTIGQKGIRLQGNSSEAVVQRSYVHDTGLTNARYGEGIDVGSSVDNWAAVTAGKPDRTNKVRVLGNRIERTAAEGVDVKEGTIGGTISANTFLDAGVVGWNSGDSWVDLKGNGWRVVSNTGAGAQDDAMQIHSIAGLDGKQIPGSGDDNVVRGNTVTGGVPGYLIKVYKNSDNNTIGCDNVRTDDGDKGISNRKCTP
ncbi:parallel beta helix pectate lyase-like protein [Motilibacter peucedani]|uniref:Parallel beta helix pectate lyase-like protein n=1 Tax=Motilibacter peucedani TaxID=598650 RepID=A0A420XQZ8_9ACTN|nr:right-handed parallel beta-helix repeat-containing protein [Motilibacter peucedani]RKS75654.1 parallel beta helix pectate lyase-like protein [Motilibacter peucedani]